MYPTSWSTGKDDVVCHSRFVIVPEKRIPIFIATRILALAFFALGGLLFQSPGQGQANLHGQWRTVPTLMPINPIHAALMHNGKILVVSGTGNDPTNASNMAGVWDPQTDTVTTQPLGWDMFCNSMIVLPDGRPMIFGGTLAYDPFHGWNRTTVYDPATEKFVDMEDMVYGRWYPTSTVLGDGRVMTFSGLDASGGTDTHVEIYKVGVGWIASAQVPWTPPLYPRMHLLPNGKTFYSGPTTQSRTFDPSSNTWSEVVASTLYGGDRLYGSSVLLPLIPANGYKPKVMIFGGGNPSVSTTEIIDLSSQTPAWTSGPSMSQPRIEMNATLLPNGKILALGGSLNDEDTSTASLQADLYDSASDPTSPMASAGSNAFPRLYHSVSILLPDATVWVAGGNPQRGTFEQHVEIYSPPYLFKADGSLAARPTITSVTPGVIGYGTSFQIQTQDAPNIASIALMRSGSPTHAFDQDQRMVGLSFTVGSGALTVTGPPDGNIAPPGYYMIFLLNTSGIPSVATLVQVSAVSNDIPPTGTITSPASDITITSGQSATFAGSGSAPNGAITGYSWVFHGGSPATSSLANPGAVTFSTPGTYTAVFTVTDSAGNTDQSPETRRITVAPGSGPVLTGVNPNVGTQGQTNLGVTFTGSNFLSSPSCNFGPGITINSCTFNSSTKITASINVLASATLGIRDVTITNTDGQSSTLTGAFTVQTGTSPPTIVDATPNQGLQGSNISVVIIGTNFFPNPSCDFGSAQGLTVSACTYNSPTKITATLSIAANAVLGPHTLVVTDTDGQSATKINGFNVTLPSGGGGISFGSGFTAGSMVLNGSSSISGTSLTITPNTTFQVGSAWFPTAVNIQNFTNDFSFQDTAGSATADGFTWALQNNSTAAIAGSGGGGDLAYTGMAKSVAVKFDLYDNAGEGTNSTGLYLNGVSPMTPALDMGASGIDLHSGHIFQVHMTYDGTNLAMTITDATTTAKFTQAWAVNIPGTVGGATAFAGFTGATGGLNALQNILSWTMSSSSGGGTVGTPTFSPAAGTYLGTQTVTLTDATSGATIFYTLDGTQPGTSAGGSTLQYTGPITVTATKTIKALATATGLTTSTTATALYTIESQVATPSFSPVGGSYSSTQTVTISTATAGATIYYTTNGSTPTTSSTLYSGPVVVGASETLKAIATKSGFFDSNVGLAAYLINSGGGGGGISFGSGFTAGSMVLNGSSSISGTSLTITSNTTFQVGSAWFPTAVNIQNFTNDFSFQDTAGSATADGFTWALQNNSTAAIAGSGGGGDLAYTGMAKSVAVKFDLYDNAGEGTNSTGLYLNGVSPMTPALDMGASGIDLHSGHIFQVHMTYDGTNLAMTITDATTTAKFTQAWAVNIPGTVGGATAFAGFTGATGGLNALQNILSWTMSSSSGGGTVGTPTFSPAAGTYLGTQTVTLTDATSGATIFYTLDGTQPGTSAGGSTLQYTGPITVTATKTIKALATATGLTTSTTATALYTIESQVATPSFSPVGGSYSSTQTVTISTATAGATIYYTTNGSTPTTSSTLYSGPVVVAASETLKAIATKSGFFDSNVGLAAYIINSGTVPPPTLTSAKPNSGIQGQANLSVTLTGSHFLSSPTCNFGTGINVNSCTYNSPTKITAKISILTSAIVGSRNITIKNSDGQSSILANGFKVQRK
jgi:hypothetical protein